MAKGDSMRVALSLLPPAPSALRLVPYSLLLAVRADLRAVPRTTIDWPG